MVKDYIPRRGLPSAGSHPTSRAHGERQLLQTMQRGRKEAVVDRPLVCSWLQRRLLQLSHLSLPLRMRLCPEAQLGSHTQARPHRTSLCWPAIAMGSNFMDPHHPNHPPALLRRPSLLLLLYAHEHRQVKEHHKGVTGPQSAMLGRSEMGFPAGVLWKQ